LTKTAIVTGASSGIGMAIAKRLAKGKINVVLVARNEEKLSALEAELNNDHLGKALAIPTDVSDQAAVQKMVEQAEKHFGQADILVNNAGVMLSAAITDGSLHDWEKMIDVNIKGILYGLHEVIPQMVARKSGHIINIASVSGFEVTKKSAVYSATKFAVRAISSGLEKELAHTGVKVTNISPGMVDTSLARRGNINRKPLDAADIAEAVYYALTQPEHVNVNEITVRPV
jgi:NADP-dependent 3-hydroxy acid dehydrogenase YdfG